MIRMVLVMSALAIVCIVAAAILHFQMPDSSLPVVILGLASATIVPAAIKAVTTYTELEAQRQKAEIEAKQHRDRADKLFEETQSLKGIKPPKNR